MDRRRGEGSGVKTDLKTAVYLALDAADGFGRRGELSDSHGDDSRTRAIPNVTSFFVSAEPFYSQ